MSADALIAEIRALLAAAGPLSSREIYKRCDSAEYQADVAMALHALRTRGEIESAPPTTPGGDRTHRLTVAVPAQPHAPPAAAVDAPAAPADGPVPPEADDPPALRLGLWPDGTLCISRGADCIDLTPDDCAALARFLPGALPALLALHAMGAECAAA